MATWDEFYKKANDEGLYDQFSAYDLNYARNNPDYGMSLLSSKIDYRDATTPEARQAANDSAEWLRSSMYGYNGGTDGSKFYLNDTPTVTNPNQPLTASAFMNFNPGQAPTRNAEYEDLYRDYLNQIINRDKFSYDAENDPNYLQYKNQYTREGNRAMQDTLGQISARTGGLASSYAGTAAAQANNYYMQQLADKIPELYQQAYNRYLKEFEMQMDTLGAIGNGRDYNLNAYQTDYDVFNTDAQRKYGQLSDYYNGYMNEQQQAKENAWTEQQMARDEEKWNLEKAITNAQYGNTALAEALGLNPDYFTKSSGGGGGNGGNGGNDNDSPNGNAYFQSIASKIIDSLNGGGWNAAMSYLYSVRGQLTEEEFNELRSDIMDSAEENGVKLNWSGIESASETEKKRKTGN